MSDDASKLPDDLPVADYVPESFVGGAILHDAPNLVAAIERLTAAVERATDATLRSTADAADNPSAESDASSESELAPGADGARETRRGPEPGDSGHSCDTQASKETKR